MKKSLIFVGMLAVGYANAQTDTEHLGKVGINTMTPKATLEVQPTATNLTGTTNEGIIAPKLSKERIAAIATPVEGTLVYATDATYAGSDAKVAKITEKGYYYYDGTEWVKSGVGANDQLWAQRDNNGITETYLKKAEDDSNFMGYHSGNAVKSAYTYSSGKNTTDSPKEDTSSLYNIDVYSDVFKNTSLSAGGFFGGTSKGFTLRNEHVLRNTGNLKNYTAHYSLGLISPDVMGKIDTFNGNISTLSIGTANDQTSVEVGRAVGGRFATHSYTTGTTTDLIGGLFQSYNHKGAVVSRIIGASVDGVNLMGNVTDLEGVRTVVTAGNGQVARMKGGYIVMKFTADAEVENAYLEQMEYNQSIVPKSLKNMYGLRIGNVSLGTDQNYSIYTGVGKVFFSDDTHTTRTFYQGQAYGNGAMSTLYGNIWSAPITASNQQWLGTNGSYRASWAWNGYRDKDGGWTSLNVQNSTIGNMIEQGEEGILFRSEDMNGITGQIAPKVRMIIDTAGEVKINSLAGVNNRPVYADANGRLIIGDATNAATSFKWVEDTSNSSVKLAVTSAGVERTDNPVSITDTGMVKATSFQGSNGATIFPDYVFQKYYDGVSDIKTDYTFKSLSQVEDFVKTNGHLPGYKSAAEIKSQGYIDLMETQLTNVEKIEELYLHTIELKKENEGLKAKNQELEARLEKLEKLLK